MKMMFFPYAVPAPPNLVPLNFRSNFLSFSPGTCTVAVISTASESAFLLDEESSDSLRHPWQFVFTCPRNLPFVIPPAFIDYERNETKISEAKYVKSWWFFPSLMSVYCKIFWIMPIALMYWAFIKKSGKTFWWFTALICRCANSGL